MEDFEDSTSDFDSSLTSSDEDTSAGGYQVIQPYSHEPLSDKKTDTVSMAVATIEADV